MTVRLTEWSEARDVELGFAQVQALRRVAGRALDFRPGSRNGAWDLTARSLVGSVRVGDLSVLIRPKITLDNVFHMLSAGQTDVAFGIELTGFGDDELLPALAAFYERLLAATLHRGVLTSYTEHRETLVALRGRIDIPAQLRSGGMSAPLPCRYDELSIDIPENRILAAAARMLAGYPDVAPDIRRNLRRTAAPLDGVAAIDPRALPAVTLTRLNRSYEPALRLAELVLGSGGLRDDTGATEASTFLVDMNRLFERFITGQLRRRLAGRLELRDQVRTHLDVQHRIPMRPDLALYRKGQAVLVGDIKYKLTDDGSGREGDYYQLLAYCTALGVCRGVLLYAADDEVPATVARVAGSDVELHVVPVSVAGTPVHVGAVLSRLADHLVRLA